MKYLQSFSDAPTAGVEVWMDKRKSKRVKYCAAIPVNSAADRVPAGAKFVQVETRDLSQNGISFYSSIAPDERMLVIQLGDDRDAIYYSARIVRCEKDYDDPERRFIIGCEFLARVPNSPN